MKAAGARTPVKDLTPQMLCDLLNAGLMKWGELQPQFVYPKSIEGMFYSEVHLPMDVDRSFASTRSRLRFFLIDGTTAILESPEVQGAELLGWDAVITRDVLLDLNKFEGFSLHIRGYFRRS